MPGQVQVSTWDEVSVLEVTVERWPWLAESEARHGERERSGATEQFTFTQPSNSLAHRGLECGVSQSWLRSHFTHFWHFHSNQPTSQPAHRTSLGFQGFISIINRRGKFSLLLEIVKYYKLEIKFEWDEMRWHKNNNQSCPTESFYLKK